VGEVVPSLQVMLSGMGSSAVVAGPGVAEAGAMTMADAPANTRIARRDLSIRQIYHGVVVGILTPVR
jgi:hypothetical protein